MASPLLPTPLPHFYSRPSFLLSLFHRFLSFVLTSWFGFHFHSIFAPLSSRSAVFLGLSWHLRLFCRLSSVFCTPAVHFTFKSFLLLDSFSCLLLTRLLSRHFYAFVLPCLASTSFFSHLFLPSFCLVLVLCCCCVSLFVFVVVVAVLVYLLVFCGGNRRESCRASRKNS